MLTTTSIQAAFAADHDRLDDLFADFQQSKRSDFARARASFLEFQVGLQGHIGREETVLFPLFERKTGLYQRGPTEVMRAEHRHIGDLLKALHRRVEQEDPNSDKEEQELVEALAAHNFKEENLLYPALDRLLSDEEKAVAFAAIENIPEVADAA